MPSGQVQPRGVAGNSFHSPQQVFADALCRSWPENGYIPARSTIASPASEKPVTAQFASLAEAVGCPIFWNVEKEHRAAALGK